MKLLKSAKPVCMDSTLGKCCVEKREESDVIVALAGNPNVGKSTVFNALTGLKQHTGNWTGKTVGNAQGYFRYRDRGFIPVDIPGTYSLRARSREEELARDFLRSGVPDAVVVVCDACALCRTITLALQILFETKRVVICVNLLDEADKSGLTIDTETLSKLLGVPVIGASARGGVGLEALKEAILTVADMPPSPPPDASEQDRSPEAVFASAEELCRKVVHCREGREGSAERRAQRRHKLDALLTSRYLSFPIIICLLALVFFITLKGANYPSQWLQELLFGLTPSLDHALTFLGCPSAITDALVYGMYRTTAWVVSVMLPPMAIFFPLFTLLEDWGFLPRIAFCLDHSFRRCHACGKQALTTCMGFGCNAAGVTSCRIIDSRRERLIAMLTNSLIPCNGRFPLLMTLIAVLIAMLGIPDNSSLLSAVLLTAFILLAVLVSMGASLLLSRSVLKGEPSAYTLELPPFRRPQIGRVLLRSMLDRTLYVLARAVIVAAPCGLMIYILGNIQVGSSTLLNAVSGFFDPFARVFGLDGTILTGFLLGMPANEIVLPLILMIYQANGVLAQTGSIGTVGTILAANGWTALTTFNVVLFSLFHWPCATTLLTLRRESGSRLMTVIGFLLPTLIGLACCLTVNMLYKLVLLLW